jgi:RHS repeat-associated protein
MTMARNARANRRRKPRPFRPALQHLERRSLLSTASFLGSDTTTKGDWRSAYGADGYVIADNGSDEVSLPGYASLDHGGGYYWYGTNTGNPYALQDASGVGDVAAIVGTNGGFDVHIGLGDGQAHRVTLYAMNWENAVGYQDGWENRSERFDVVDDATNTVLSSASLPSFTGTYLSWEITGDVTIHVVNTSPTSFAVLSGIFFGGPVIPAASATFVGSDTTTKGDWRSAYGGDGYVIAANGSDEVSLPGYASASHDNPSSYWHGTDTGNPYALQDASGVGDIAAIWWAGVDGFGVHVGLDDGRAHRVTLYAMNWENAVGYQDGWENRSERFDVVDDATHALLSSASLPSFTGTYLSWEITGDVTIHVVNTSPTSFAVLSAIFFDSATSQANGETIHAVEGQAFTGTVATFIPPDPGAQAGDFAATIDWGDGHTSTGTVAEDANGTFSVVASNTYAAEGAYPIEVEVDGPDGYAAVATGLAEVAFAPITSAGTSFSATAGQAFAGAVATFSGPSPGESANSYAATIDWGDGQVSEGLIAPDESGGYDVTGSHVYARAGSYDVAATIADAGGAASVAHASAVVAAVPLTASGLPAFGVPAESLFSGTVATFTAGPGDPVGDFSATIDWGDGAVTTGTIVAPAGPGDPFSVSGEYLYPSDEVGFTRTITVTIADGLGDSAGATTHVVVNAPASFAVAATEGTPFSGRVASFRPPAGSRAGDFAATINWGDQDETQTVGVVSDAGDGTFNVSGTNTYSLAGTYAYTISITGPGGYRAVLGGESHVDDAQIIATGLALAPMKGQAFNAEVASFTDADPDINQFAVMINWGDGTQATVGAVVGSDGSGEYAVYGQHMYADTGTYTVNILLQKAWHNSVFLDNVVRDITTTAFVQDGATYCPGQIITIPGCPCTDLPATLQMTSSNTTANNGLFQSTELVYGPTPAEFTPLGLGEKCYLSPSYFTDNSTGDHFRYYFGCFSGFYIITRVFQVSILGSPYKDTIRYKWFVGFPGNECDGPDGFELLNGQIYVGGDPSSVVTITGGAAQDTHDDDDGNDPPPNPVDVAGLVGVPTGPVVVATGESDRGPDHSFCAAISWGDDSRDTTGFVVWTDDTHYAVLGNHTYWSAGTHTIKVYGIGATSSGDVPSSTATITAGGLSGGVRAEDADQAELLHLGEADVALDTGGLRVAQPLDFDRSPGTGVGGDPELVYNSDTVSARPVVQAVLATDPTLPLPSAIQVQLTWDGTAQPWATVDTTGHLPGDSYLLAAQVAAPVAQSGYYPWSLHVREFFVDGRTPIDAEISGGARVVVNDSLDPYGAGWGIAGVDRLVPTPVGLLWVDGDGTSRFFAGEDPLGPDILAAVGGGTGNGKIVFADPPGTFGQLVETVAGRQPQSFTFTDPHGTVWVFDAQGLLASVTDRDGLTTAYTYDGPGLVGVLAPDGGITTLTYSGSLLSTITEPGDRVVTLTYDGYDLASITDAGGSLRTMAYDASHHLINDRWGPLNATFTYDNGTGLLTGDDRGLGTVDQITPAALQGLQTPPPPPLPPPPPAPASALGVATVQDALGHVTTYTLDFEGRILRLDRPGGIEETWRRDDQGLVASYTDPLQKTTNYVYNDIINYYNKYTSYFTYPAYYATFAGRSGDLLQVDHPDGGFEHYRYDPALALAGPLAGQYVSYNEATQESDSLGEVTQYSYDPLTGDLLTATDATGAVTTYTWSQGLLQTVTEPANGRDGLARTTTYVYDGARRLQVMIDPKGGRTTYTYDAAGNPQTVTDPDGVVTTTVYDPLNRLVAEIDPAPDEDSAPLVTTMAYDAIGDLIGETDPRGVVTSWGYDRRGFLTRETDGVGTTDERITTTVYDLAGDIVSTIDARGKETDYGYDAAGRQIWVRDPVGDLTTIVYDPAGDVVSTIDARGIETDYAYDSMGRETSVTVGVGRADARTTTMVYNRVGEVIETIDPRGIEADEQYDEDGRLVAVTVGVGTAAPETTRTVYDADGNVAETIDPRGVETRYTYDADDRPTSVTEAAGTVDARTTTTVYDPAGRVTRTIDPLGFETTYAYDRDGRVVGVTEGSNTAHPRTTLTHYDPAGHVASTVDARGVETDYTYNAEGQVTSVTEAVGTPLARTTTTVYDKAGHVVSTIDARGIETDYAYDDAGRQITMTEGANTPNPRITRTYYDPDGNVASVLDARGVETDYTYNAEGQVTSVTEAVGTPLARTTYTHYDKDGNVDYTIDPDGIETDYTYDAEGRQTSVTQAAGTDFARTTTTIYDKDGNVTATIDPLEHETDYRYDQFGRQVRSQDAEGHVTWTAYDADGNVTAVTDPDHNTTTYAYDAFGDVTAMTDPLGHTATYVYDDGGNLTSTTDRDGRRTDTTYDALGRPTQERWYDASGTLVDTINRTFDPDDDLLTASDGNGSRTTTFTYDPFGEVATEQGPFGPTQTYGYDADGNRTTVTDSLGGVTTSVYDAFGRLTSRQSGGTGAGTDPLRVDLTYTPAGLVRTATSYSDLEGAHQVGVTTYQYDAADRLKEIKHSGAGGSVTADYAYTHDLADRLTSEVDNGTTTTYSYDRSDQLTGDGTGAYDYDANGNRTTGGAITGPGNRLEYDGTYAYAYDAEGNRVEKVDISTGETWTYAYDNDNHLTSAEDRSGPGGALIRRVTEVYDATGERVEEDVYTAATGATTVQRYANDGSDVYADLDGSNGLQTRYLYDAVDAVLAREGSDGAIAWYLTDRLGSVRDLLDGTGAEKDHIDYDGFGNVTNETDPAFGDRYKFAGMQAGAATGLALAQARWYDPATGAWTSQDPLGFDAGDANLYRYVGNDPTNDIDPTGMLSFSGTFSYLADQAKYAAKKADQALGVAGTFALTGSVVGMDSASGLGLLGAAKGGAVTGFKAVTNGAATAAVNTATLGLNSRPVELFSVTDADRANGYDLSAGIAQFSTEFLIGVGTGGAASALAKGGRAARVAGGSLVLFDAAGNAVGAARGGADWVQNGPTLANTVQIAGGVLGLAGNAVPIYAARRAALTAEANAAKLEVQAAGYGTAAERGLGQVPPASERTPLSVVDPKGALGSTVRLDRAVVHPNNPALHSPNPRIGKAPSNVLSGERVLEGVYIDDVNLPHGWRAYYDQQGRLVARTDFDPRGGLSFPGVHHHTYRYTRGGVIESPHIPGEYTP